MTWTPNTGTPDVGTIVASFNLQEQADSVAQVVTYTHSLSGDQHATSDAVTQVLELDQRLTDDTFIVPDSGNPYPSFPRHRRHGW